MRAITLDYELGLSNMKNDFTNLVMGFFDETDEHDEQQKYILSVILLQPEALLSVIAEMVKYLMLKLYTLVNTNIIHSYFTDFTTNLFSRNIDSEDVCRCDGNNNIISTSVNNTTLMNRFSKFTFVNMRGICTHYINNGLFFINRKIKAFFSFFLFNFGKKLIRQWG